MSLDPLQGSSPSGAGTQPRGEYVSPGRLVERRLCGSANRATGGACHRETEPDSGPVLVGERGREPGRVDAVPAGYAPGHDGSADDPAAVVGDLRAGEQPRPQRLAMPTKHSGRGNTRR